MFDLIKYSEFDNEMLPENISWYNDQNWFLVDFIVYDVWISRKENGIWKESNQTLYQNKMVSSNAIDKNKFHEIYKLRFWEPSAGSCFTLIFLHWGVTFLYHLADDLKYAVAVNTTTKYNDKVQRSSYDMQMNRNIQSS